MSESETKNTELSYRDAGVDIDAGNTLVEMIKPAVKATMRPEVLTGLGGFGGLFQLDTSRYHEPVLVSGTDGVGTKLMLARQLGIHDSIGIDLVAMCVNDILTCGAEPLFFLDYFATGKLDTLLASKVVGGIAAGCKQAGCALIGGETAEMPGMYEGSEYDLAGFTVGVVNRQDMIDGSQIQAGDVILGLPSSGPHSNGYSLIRKVLEVSGADTGRPLSENAEVSLGQALLEPTRIYVRTVQRLLESCRPSGLAHITGGGLTENIIRVVPAELSIEINLSAWTRPPVFSWLEQAGNIPESEMLRTFNCGIGMALIVPPHEVQAVQDSLAEAGEAVFVIGSVRADDPTNRVQYTAD